MPLPIKDLLKAGESEHLEFKKSFGKEVLETICAFSNHKGGSVLIGVDNSGDVTGVECKKETLQEWTNQVKLSTSPSIVPDIKQFRIANKQIIAIIVGEFPVKPVAVRGKYFKRVSNSNHQLSLTEIANLHLQSLQLSWDSYKKDGAVIEDLCKDKVEDFLKRVHDGKRFEVSGTWQTILLKLGFLKSGNPTQAAILLFGRPDPPYSIHIGRFKTPSVIIDDRMIRGTLFEVVEQTMKFLVSHLKVAFNITGEIQRQEIFEYPITALRETLLNAVVHRDYTSPVDIQIKIFDQSISFFNPGRLYGDLTIDKLRGDSYQSRSRNKLISEAFYLTSDIEKYGSGFIRIREEIKKFPTMSFDYEESGDGFLVSLNYLQQKISANSPKINEGINELLDIININPGKRTTTDAIFKCSR